MLGQLQQNCSLELATVEASALFVSTASALSKSSGGVQICTQEYLQSLKLASFAPSIIDYEPDKRILVRLMRHLRSRPYADRLPPSLINDVVANVESQEIRFIFLNQVSSAPLAASIKARLGNKCKVILLSHGLESVDYLHAVRAKGEGSAFSQMSATDLSILAQQLVAECKHRQYIDTVFCLSPFEMEIERWLGAKQVTWLPRIIPHRRLDWNPKPERLGFVGTVDHPPNAEGLILFLEALQKLSPQNVRLRLVGGPTSAATAIAKRFPMVEYLGQLSNTELEQEASTWSCFVHPIFCYARGCSTKLAVALGWEIPLVTTSSGCRGYTWREGNLPLAETPESLAKLALQTLEPEVAARTKQEITAIARSAPTLADVAARVRSALLPLVAD